MATKKTQAADQRVEVTRTRFRTLLAGNPNYFGNLVGSPFKVVKKLASNTNYEELTSVGYNQHIRRLFATFDVKKAFGYSGDLCDDGSTEYVRFYVDFGGGWQDAGLVAADVHDIPTGKDCANKNLHPLSYSLELPYSPDRKWCSSPQLPVVRAILSWNVEPPAGSPNWKPVYGNVEECHIQIDKSWWFKHFLDDLVLKAKIPPELIASVTPLIPPIDPEIPDIPGLPEPPLPAVEAGSAGGKPELTLAERVELYSGPTRGKFLRANVEPSRFAFNEVQALTTKAAIDIGAVDEISAALQKFDLNLDDLVLQVEDTTGNINFEELVDVGLDGNRDKIVATYMVKKASGFSGGLCTAGSLEYVAFWADWNDTCDWEYLDTVKVRAYDFDELPDGGLCYSAALPVDLDEFKRKCQDPKVARIRAVLSWNSPPSTTDPDQLPTWGNRLDAHALVPRLEGSPGLMSVIGGLSVFYIDDTTGMATPTAKFTDTGTTVYSPSGDTVPFGGLIVVRGPAVANKRYRIQVIDSDGDSQTLTEKIWISPSNGGAGSYHTGTADGWFDYKQYAANFSSILGYYRSNQNDKVTIQLEIEGDGVVDTQAVQLDNIRPDVAVTITAPGTDCGLFESGVVMEGLVDATDVHMGAWRVEIDGGPAGFGPVVVATGDADTAPGGTAWKYSTKGLLQCGYIVRVVASDRAIAGSGNSQHHRSADVGFCILT